MLPFFLGSACMSTDGPWHSKKGNGTARKKQRMLFRLATSDAVLKRVSRTVWRCVRKWDGFCDRAMRETINQWKTRALHIKTVLTRKVRTWSGPSKFSVFTDRYWKQSLQVGTYVVTGAGGKWEQNKVAPSWELACPGQCRDSLRIDISIQAKRQSSKIPCSPQMRFRPSPTQLSQPNTVCWQRKECWRVKISLTLCRRLGTEIGQWKCSNQSMKS